MVREGCGHHIEPLTKHSGNSAIAHSMPLSWHSISWHLPRHLTKPIASSAPATFLFALG